MKHIDFMRTGIIVCVALLMTGGLHAQLNGTYTIGASGSDFINFHHAVDSLISVGVSGKVTFNVYSGVYIEQITIPEITGSSTGNTITFQSANGNNASVILTDTSSTTSLKNYTVKLDGADNIIFKDITIQRTGSNNYSLVVDVSNGATGNKFLNNHLTGVVTTMAATYQSVVYSTGTEDTYNTFSGNTIENGSFGINLLGQGSTMRETGNVITGNTFVNQYERAISLSYQESATVNFNIITADSTNNSFEGIYAFYCYGNFNVLKNNIYIPNGGIGIYSYYCCGGCAGGTGMLMANNFITIGGTTLSAVGISVNLSSKNYVYYNSIHITNTNKNSRAVQVAGASAQNVEIINNVFANTGGGYAYYVAQEAISAIIGSDYNDIYTIDTIYAYWGDSLNQKTLSAWQTVSGFDNNSVRVTPDFNSATNLHTSSGLLNKKGTSLSSAALPVTNDIDGEPRHALTPDIGADEFDVDDLGVVAINTDTCHYCVPSSDTVRIYIKNFGKYNYTGDVVSFYRIDNASIVKDTVKGITINSGDSILFSFDKQEQFNVTGTHTIIVSTVLSTDIDNLNDTLTGIPVVIDTIPIAAFTYTANGTEVTFSDTSLYAAEYLWDFGDGETDSLRNPVHTYDSSGTYAVTLIVGNPCGADTSVIDSISVVGIHELNYTENINIFPNPADDYIYIDFLSSTANHYSVKIINATGQVVFANDIKQTGVSTHKIIDVSSYKEGLYSILFVSDKGIIIRKVVVL